MLEFVNKSEQSKSINLTVWNIGVTVKASFFWKPTQSICWYWKIILQDFFSKGDWRNAFYVVGFKKALVITVGKGYVYMSKRVHNSANTCNLDFLVFP